MSPPDTDDSLAGRKNTNPPAAARPLKETQPKDISAAQQTLLERLQRELKPILQKLPRAQESGVLQGVLKVVKEESYKGPLPHPAHFEHYERAVPGSADRILTMAEKEQENRHRWERLAITFEFAYSIGGLIFGFLVGLCLIAAAVWTAMHGHPAIAGAFISVSAVGMVSTFINGRDIFGNSEKPPKPNNGSRKNIPSTPAKRRPRSQ